MKIIQCKQGSDYWHQLHVGRLSSSRFDAVLRGKLRTWERIARAMQHYTVPFEPSVSALRWGLKYEHEARELYSYPNKIKQVGAIVGTDSRYVVSPDGIIDADAFIEIKCPYNNAIFLRYRRARTLPNEYRAQVQGIMWIGEFSLCRFIAYDPREPRGRNLVSILVERDNAYIARLKQRCDIFWQFYSKFTRGKEFAVPTLQLF
jgi:hypothetical protein